ncbi:MAG: RNA polymerase subunit sigma [Salinisphaeraceae bacterium]|jgi:RNA polymerase sigma-70 factor (ECF subfamily)|nr:RNA polymerase subunit sigma [Salinisphaeraceae bacterium]
MYSADHSLCPALYQDNHQWLTGWLRRRLDCHHTAEDLAHDTFLRLITRGKPNNQFGREPRALLTHIAKGLMIDRWRRQDVERAYLEALAQVPDAQAPSEEARLVIIETLVRIDAMLCRMPAKTRRMFLLAQLGGCTLQQISQRTDTPVITVRRHIRKALVACMVIVEQG